MVTAFMLINAAPQAINDAAQALVDMEEIAEVYSVAGEWDLVAVVRVQDNEGLARAVTERALKVEGIVKSTTLIAFQAYSHHDLERLFSIGFDE